MTPQGAAQAATVLFNRRDRRGRAELRGGRALQPQRPDPPRSLRDLRATSASSAV